MKTWLSRSICAAVLAAALIPTPTAFAAVSAAMTAACSDLDTSARSRRTCTSELQKSLQADPATVKALQRAMAAANEDGLKAALAKLGLSQAELADAVVVIDDKTAGAARFKSIDVTITCCPLTITIIIRL